MTFRSLLLGLVACSIPSEADVEEATGKAVDQCRAILDEQVPRIVGQVATAAIAACATFQATERDTQGLIATASDVVVYRVLLNLGCDWDGQEWDRSKATLLCGER